MFLSNWLREDKEGKALEEVDMRRRSKEERKRVEQSGGGRNGKGRGGLSTCVSALPS